MSPDTKMKIPDHVRASFILPIILFALRLFFYFSVIVLIFIHPGISVSFDRTGIMQWFVVIPLMAIIAFLPADAANAKKKYLFALAALVLLSAITAGFSFDALIIFAAGLISFILSILLFQKNQIPFLHSRFANITALEPFLLAWVCLRLLALSRSGEDIAGESIVLTQFILVWTAAVFLFHNAVIYLALNPNSRVKAWKEGIVISFSALAVFVIVLVILPPDFVRNMIIENLATERIPERIQPSDAERGLPRRGNGRRTLPLNEGNGRGELRGVSEHEWPGTGDGSGESRQYLVKIVASQREPVYMGESFRGLLDPVEGFLPSPQEPLNQIAGQRIFVTWFNTDREYNYDRRRNEVFSLSTLQRKYFPWRPFSADPVILNENSGPLRYIHQVASDMHIDDPLLLVNNYIRYFSEREKTALAPYLETPLNNEDKKVFEDYLRYAQNMWRENRDEIIAEDRYLSYVYRELGGESGNEYIEKIIAILTSFSDFRYNLAYNDDSSISALKEFILNTKDGDCVEFSNTLALLGRLAGIPSRVVTGYLAAEGLQTPAHLDGLSVLRSRIPFLQQFPFDNLFMVTNAHSHSWTQFYIPNYGWLDFEATSFSIPPEGMGDFNNWDVVIPILDGNRTFSQVRKFPWQAAGRAALVFLITALVCAYVLRYGRELILYLGTRKGNVRSRARCLYLLLLARLAADGQPIKPASKTAHEYAELFSKKKRSSRGDAETQKEDVNEAEKSIFKSFAEIYSELRWKEFSDQAEADERYNLLKKEYFNIIKISMKKGLHRWFIRLISLRGLAYL